MLEKVERRHREKYCVHISGLLHRKQYTGVSQSITTLGNGGSFAPRTGAFQNGHLGFGSTGNWGDSTYRFSLTFEHSYRDLVLGFTSLQNQPPPDEGWGLDNVNVSLNH
uniref:Uncharacterized protein n=1 Tax=Candidatus Kentrum sp. MB TaxID=2138164 RepID=A0A450Y2V5_9GAMM|nr:MAG: hypothetical protein BECKMB1821G_GA0114241_11401 [Candidatus Kentron sp. MB]VFK35870.1 MAG: hypothetical protein BECKMB1821I_GA0114274_11555 [Candidatus Kentron sp. MB]VFK77507.1 MAG: hypothetical protein BECKMB1821H_GA0114242_11505 [Candidatus Kentron sp. MB]